jgi:hypothetical protein
MPAVETIPTPGACGVHPEVGRLRQAPMGAPGLTPNRLTSQSIGEPGDQTVRQKQQEVDPCP